MHVSRLQLWQIQGKFADAVLQGPFLLGRRRRDRSVDRWHHRASQGSQSRKRLRRRYRYVRMILPSSGTIIIPCLPERGWFASDVVSDDRILLYGGLNAKNEREDDGILISFS